MGRSLVVDGQIDRQIACKMDGWMMMMMKVGKAENRNKAKLWVTYDG